MDDEIKLKAQREAVVTRSLEIQVQQRAAQAGGPPLSSQRWNELKLELAQLNLEKHQLEIRINACAKQRRIERRNHAHNILIGLVEAAGRSDLVIESERQAAWAQRAKTQQE